LFFFLNPPGSQQVSLGLWLRSSTFLRYSLGDIWRAHGKHTAFKGESTWTSNR